MDYPDTSGRPASIVWRGQKYWRHKNGYYFPGKHGPNRGSLHRHVYETAYGPIPPGMDVHHRDGNQLNNMPSNLEIKPSGEHQSEHMLEKFARPEFRIRNAAALAKAQKAATNWHKSEAGRAWHTAKAIEQWKPENRQSLDKQCIECGAAFTATQADARFCSMRCFQRVAIRDGRYNTLDATCAYCGTQYKTSRHDPIKTCSRSCGAKLRWRQKRAS